MDASPEVQDTREERLEAVLSAYLEAGDAGWAPQSDWMLTRYPDLADDLRAYFEVESRVIALASPGSRATSPPNGNGKYAHREPRTIATLNVRPRASKPAAPPMSVDDYTSLEVLKEGGMGIVYRAWQKGANRWVALKMIRAGQFARPAEVRRFRAEAEAVASLDHPNIVPIYDVGEYKGLPFFSMKLFETGSLHQHLERYTRDIAAGVKLLSTVCRAVHYGHQRGILHRDLKPANILLDAQGQPHVTDFGLAKRLFPAAPPARPTGGAGEAAEPTPQSPAPKQATVVSQVADDAATVDELPADVIGFMAPEQARKADEATISIDHAPNYRTVAGSAVGTPGYLAPELARIAKTDVSSAADVFSLGAILYRLLTGRTLFSTSSRTEALRLAWEGVPDAPRKVNPRTDEKLEAICLKCLEREPVKRYASAEALAEDLDRWSRGEWPLSWTPPRRLRVLRTVRRNALVVGLTACAMFAVGMVFALYFLAPDRLAERTAAALENEATRQRVVLLGATGTPRWSRWNMGQGNNIVWSGPDAPFTFAALERSRLELLRKAPGPRYRFSAEVKHEAAHDHSKVGIYFGYSEQATPDEVKRYWWDLEFADTGYFARNLVGPDKNRKYGAIRLEMVRQVVPLNFFVRTTEVSELFVSSEETRTQPSWRQLAVEIRPEQVRFLWEGHTFREMTLADLHNLGEVTKGFRKLPEMKLTVDGALGVFVDHGKASFRNIIVEPLE